MPDLDANGALLELDTFRPQAIAKVRYTGEDMIDFIISNPGVSQNAIAARYGYTPGWVSRMLASDAMQERLASRRREIVDPAIAATIDERFRALAIRSVEVLMTKLDSPGVEASVALRAAELGAKAIGIGGHAAPPPAPEGDPLERLAKRLVALNAPQPPAIVGEFTKETADANSSDAL